MPAKAALGMFGPDGHPPWPDLLITAGRHSVLPALAVKQASGGRTVLVAVQDPRIDPARFDLVVVPKHDRARGPNVLVTRGAMNRVTPERLAVGKARLEAGLAHLPHPRIAVVIGGDSKVHRLPPALAARIASQLRQLAETHGLMVTLSRRTSQAAADVLRAGLDHPNVQLWDGTGENPYFGYLALADAVIVTEDSVSMTSEAAATGKPVHSLPLEGGSPKFDAFHASMRAEGITRPFRGTIEQWTYPVLDDTTAVAAKVRALLAERGLQLPATGSVGILPP